MGGTCYRETVNCPPCTRHSIVFVFWILAGFIPAWAGDACLGAHSDIFEPNDTFGDAVPIGAGTHLNLFVANDDRDYYSVIVLSGEKLTIAVLDSDHPLAFQVWRNGILMAVQEGGVELENFALLAVEYVVRPFVLASSPEPCATYSLQVTLEPTLCSPGVDDAFEPNDDCSTAVALTPGIYMDLVSRRSDLDFYSLAVLPGEIIRVAELQDTGGELVFRLRSPDCSALLVPFGASGFQFEYDGTVPTELILEAWVAPSGNGVQCTVYGFDLYVGPNPCLSAPDDAFEDNDSCGQAAPGRNGRADGLWVHKDDEDHYRYTVPDGARLQVDLLFFHADGNVDCRLWGEDDALCSIAGNAAALTRSTSDTDYESLAWVNRSGLSMDVVLEVRLHPASFSSCNTYDLIVEGHEGDPPVGTAFCGPGATNSDGESTLLVATQGGNIGSGLHLEARYGPPQEFGYFLVSGTFREPGTAIGRGFFCLGALGGSPCCRYNVVGNELNSIGRFDANGELQNLAGTSLVGSGFDVPATLPLPGAPLIGVGQTWHFQAWHRDGAGTSNFSNGLSVQF
jgi:hypothetical protein